MEDLLYPNYQEPEVNKQLQKKKPQVFKSYEQSQEFLLPSSTEDFVGKTHIARLVSYLIDRMDIRGCPQKLDRKIKKIRE